MGDNMSIVSVLYVLLILFMPSHLRDDDGTDGDGLVGHWAYPMSTTFYSQVRESGMICRYTCNYGKYSRAT
jgi:hypothetical protein